VHYWLDLFLTRLCPEKRLPASFLRAIPWCIGKYFVVRRVPLGRLRMCACNFRILRGCIRNRSCNPLYANPFLTASSLAFYIFNQYCIIFFQQHLSSMFRRWIVKYWSHTNNIPRILFVIIVQIKKLYFERDNIDVIESINKYVYLLGTNLFDIVWYKFVY